MRDEDWRDNGVSGKFREELIKILEKPYNEREYGDLWQMYTCGVGLEDLKLKLLANLMLIIMQVMLSSAMFFTVYKCMKSAFEFVQLSSLLSSAFMHD